MDNNSVVDVATRYGLEGPVIKSFWLRDFRTRLERHWGPPNLL